MLFGCGTVSIDMFEIYMQIYGEDFFVLRVIQIEGEHAKQVLQIMNNRGNVEVYPEEDIQSYQLGKASWRRWMDMKNRSSFEPKVIKVI